MKENKLIPKRRFKEFQNDEAWEQRKLGEVFDKLQNNSLSRANLNYEHGIANNVHYGDILTIFGECLDVGKVELPYINNSNSVDKYKTSFLDNGDVVFADAAEDETVGKCIEMKGLTTQIIISGLHTIPCRPKQNFGRGYLGYYLNSDAYHDQLLPLMQGTKVSSISRTALNETYIKYPESKEEQKQIGTFLTNLDKLITLHQRKLKKLKETKSAYLSEMFPKEREKYPKQRFAGFTGPWKQRKLGEVVRIIMGQSPSSENYTDNPNDHILVQGNADMKNGRVLPCVWTTQVTKQVEKNDLILSIRAPVGDVGKTDYNIVLGRGVAGIKGNEFIFQLLTKMKEDGYWRNLSTGSTFESINSNDIKEAYVLIPNNEEQDKIGLLFNSLDNLITFHQRKLTKLENLKKAYLNELFV